MNDGNVEYANVSDAYEAKLKQIEVFSENFLKFIPRRIPDYPSHGVDHSQNIIVLLDKFIEAWSIDITEKESYLLYLGAWVHDIGNITGRDGHNKKSAEIVGKIPFFESILGKDIVTLLKWIAKAHSSKYPLKEVPKNCLSVRLQLVCSIFRIIDACEIANSKCPSEVYELIKDDLVSSKSDSDKYWKAHMSVIGVWFKVPNIGILVDDLEFSNILIEHLKEEIDSVRDVLDTNGIPVPRVEVAIDDCDYD